MLIQSEGKVGQYLFKHGRDILRKKSMDHIEPLIYEAPQLGSFDHTDIRPIPNRLWIVSWLSF